MRFYSPLRYPGGKRKLAPYIRSLIEVNGLVGCDYVEPYAGGANVALQLLFEDIVHDIYINDISIPIYSFWKSILENTRNFCKLIETTTISMKIWSKQKRILDNLAENSTLEIGFAAFFLNRTNYSGVLSGGVIGGKNQNGKYKMDVRFNKQNLIDRIERIADHSSRIHASNLDAKVFINTVFSELKNKKFLYLDPPYYIKGRKLYINYYTHQDHLEISKLLAQLKDTYWIISYDNVEPIQSMYKNFQSIPYTLQYNAKDHYLGDEVLFCNKLIGFPVRGNPLAVC